MSFTSVVVLITFYLTIFNMFHGKPPREVEESGFPFEKKCDEYWFAIQMINGIWFMLAAWAAGVAD